MPRNKMVNGAVRPMTAAEDAQADLDSARVDPVNNDLTATELMLILEQHGSAAVKANIAAKCLAKSTGQNP